VGFSSVGSSIPLAKAGEIFSGFQPRKGHAFESYSLQSFFGGILALLGIVYIVLKPRSGRF